MTEPDSTFAERLWHGHNGDEITAVLPPLGDPEQRHQRQRRNLRSHYGGLQGWP
jgi:rRNA maturation protein Nop10